MNKKIEQDQEYLTKDLGYSSYNIGDYLILIIIISGLTAALSISYFHLPNIIMGTLIVVLISFVIYFVSYFYLKRIKFYPDRIDICYAIKHNSKTVKSVQLEEVKLIKFVYTGEKGSGDLAHVKLIYYELGRQKTIRSSILCHKVANISTFYKQIGKNVETQGFGS
ncbi:MAG: hypothetical protein WCP61_09920 [Chitinophagia bacterium]